MKQPSGIVEGMAKDAKPDSVYERIYAVVRRIPRGRVCTYGRVAELAGNPGAARQVGYALHALPEHTTVPWHRVINAQGGCSTAGVTVPPDLQQRLLEAEGIVFNEKGRCQIEKYLWAPPEYEEEAKRGNKNQGDLFS